MSLIMKTYNKPKIKHTSLDLLMIKFAVIGYGYWGPNIVRNLMAIQETTVSMVCDTDTGNLKKAKSLYPHIKICQNRAAGGDK